MAQEVLEHSPHCLLVGEGAERFARSHGITMVPNESLISTHSRKAWQHWTKHKTLSTLEGVASNEVGELEEGRDTVGAVVYLEVLFWDV